MKKNCHYNPFSISLIAFLCFFVSFSMKGQVKCLADTAYFATYFGGPPGGNVGQSIMRDKFGNTYVTGTAQSDSGIATKGAFQTSYGGNADAFLAKFNCAGRLVWGTYFGGSGYESVASMNIDDSGYIYITGVTTSDSGIATSGAYQTKDPSPGFEHGFIAKFDSSGSRLWATYYAGNETEFPAGIITDKAGNIYVSGNTDSYSGIATSGTYDTSFLAGRRDAGGLLGTAAFLAKFNSSGSHLLWATYYGGPTTYSSVGNQTWGNGIALDSSGNVYMVGSTTSTSGIATGGAYQTSLRIDTTIVGGDRTNVFLSKFNSNGGLLWATYYGGNKSDGGNGVATDGSNVYITGSTLSDSGIATSGAYQISYGGSEDSISSPLGDAFLAKFNSTGAMQWATYYGGSGDDAAWGIYSDDKGSIYLTGQTASSSGIASAGAYQPCLSGSQDAFLAKFSSSGTMEYGTYFGNSSLGYGIVADNSGNAYITGNAVYIISTPGAYQTSFGGSYLGYSDAFWAKLNTTVVYPPNNLITALFYSSAPTCTNNPILFSDSSKCALSGAINSWRWSFGDGDSSSFQNPVYTYSSTGIYRVKLTVSSSGGCSDTFSKTIFVDSTCTKSNFLTARFSYPDTACTYTSISFTDSSKSVSCGTINHWLWAFGDGDTSSAQNPAHTYNTGGIYTVKLTVSSSGGCTDSFSKTIFVDSTCVWPGDANNNKLVEVTDFLNIGIAYNDSGPSRGVTNNIWKGQYCDNWGKRFLAGSADYKHADCNGDGVVDSFDALAVNINWGSFHYKTGTPLGNPGNPPFYLKFAKPTYSPGDTVVADMVLGDSSKTLNNAYGFAFAYNYSSAYIKPNTIKVTFTNSWLGNPANNTIYLIRNDTTSSQLNLAITRIDHSNVSGMGKIGTISFVTDNNIAGKTVIFTPVQAKLISFQQADIPIYLGVDSFVGTVQSGIAAVNNGMASVNIFPDPAKGIINIQAIHLNTGNVTINIRNMLGQTIMQTIMETDAIGTLNKTLDIRNLSAGYYTITLQQNGSMVTRKLLVE